MSTKADVDAGLALKANINSPAFTGSPSTPTPAIFDTSAAIANMSALQSAKGSYNYLRGSHTGQITETMLGNAIQVAGNVTLPGCTSKHAGAAVTLFATANVTVSVSNPAVDFIYEPGLLGLQNTTRSITLAPGEEVVLANRGGAEWNVVGGNLVATRLCAKKSDTKVIINTATLTCIQRPNSSAPSGYEYECWGVNTLPGNGSLLTLPITYKDAYSFNVRCIDGGNGVHITTAIPYSANQIQLFGIAPGATVYTASTAFRWSTCGLA